MSSSEVFFQLFSTSLRPRLEFLRLATAIASVQSLKERSLGRVLERSSWCMSGFPVLIIPLGLYFTRPSTSRSCLTWCPFALWSFFLRIVRFILWLLQPTHLSMGVPLRTRVGGFRALHRTAWISNLWIMCHCHWQALRYVIPTNNSFVPELLNLYNSDQCDGFSLYPLVEVIDSHYHIL